VSSRPGGRGGDGGGFDPGAPVTLLREVDLVQSPSVAWGLLSDVGAWPRWSRVVRFASLRGGLEPGAALYWSADGIRISSVLVEVEAPRRLGWTLRTMGGRGYMRWTLQETPSGGTRVRLEECWQGLAVWIFRGTFRRTLELSRTDFIESLGRACEATSPG
jgi:hypothetical protein